MVGGLEEAVAQLAVHLERQGDIRCSVVTLDRPFGDLTTRLPRADTHLGVPIRRIPFRGSTRYPIAPTVLGALSGADLVHVHAIDFFFDFLAATRLLHRRPLVASTHGGFFHTSFASSAKKLWFNSATRASARGYCRIFGSSDNDAATFRRIAPERTIALENGVNIDKWRNAASASPVPTMIFIGRFSSNKNVPALIELIAALGDPWRLIVAGQPSELSAGDLEAAAMARGVRDRIEIHANPNDSAVRTLIERSSYIASASRYEGFGLSVVEGLSAGLTPVLSGIAPFRRLVERTSRGVVLDFENPRAAAEALKATHRSAGSERVANLLAAESFGWPGVAARFAAEYRAALNSAETSLAHTHRAW